jgi:hypothetical protein
MSAEHINTGTMLADRIKGGTLTLNGNGASFGKLNIINGAGTSLIYNDNEGFKVANNGVIACGSFVRNEYPDVDSDEEEPLYRMDVMRGGRLDMGSAFNMQVSRLDVLGALQARFDTEPMYPVNSGTNRVDLAFNDRGMTYYVENDIFPGALTLGSYTNSRSAPYIILINPDDFPDELIEEDAPSWIQSLIGDGGTGNNQLYSINLRYSTFLDGDLYMPDNCNLYVGGEKHRIVKTDDYSTRLQYCYETASPYFGDIGTGKTDESGECYIFFDDIFRETISTGCEYAVFLQKEGPGDLWVAEKQDGYFLVKGAANTPFSWELKAKQRDYENKRLEKFSQDPEYEETIPEDGYTEPDYSAEGAQIWEEYINEQEGITT